MAQTQLEKYYDKGWLRFGNRRIYQAEKLSAGKRFQQDFYHSRIDTMTAINWAKEKVDTSLNAEVPPFVWDARNRFIKALRAIKKENLSAIQTVVLEDKPVAVEKEDASQYAHDHALAQHFLCCGLDDLAIHYGWKPVKQKIVGFYHGKGMFER